MDDGSYTRRASPGASVDINNAYTRCEQPHRAEVNIQTVYANMLEYLKLEEKFQPRLSLPNEKDAGEISRGERDGAVHVLRSLKIWYDLPSEVLFHAINLLDRFLTKMKVRGSHLPCLSVACMKLAIQCAPGNTRPTTHELVKISRSACSSGDVDRMAEIVNDKLGALGTPLTSLHWLRLYVQAFRWAAHTLDCRELVDHLVQESTLVNQLEIVMMDAECVNIRAPELALVVLLNQLEESLRKKHNDSDGVAVPHSVHRLFDFAEELQRLCKMNVCTSRARIACRVRGYERGARVVTACWRSRPQQHLHTTRRNMAPTPLPTIMEQKH